MRSAPVVIDGLNEPSPIDRENGIFNVLTYRVDVVIRSEELFMLLAGGREIGLSAIHQRALGVVGAM